MLAYELVSGCGHFLNNGVARNEMAFRESEIAGPFVGIGRRLAIPQAAQKQSAEQAAFIQKSAFGSPVVRLRDADGR